MAGKHFECAHCLKQFSTETGYLRHKCKEMIRHEEMKTITGQVAWSIYQKWMKARRKPVAQQSSFIKSSFYKSFIRFADFSRKSGMSYNLEKFIDWVILRDYNPPMWLMPDVYGEWLGYLEKNETPLDCFNKSVLTLLDYSDAADVDVSEVFNVILPTEVIHYVKCKKLSPWFLLNSEKFKEYYRNRIKGSDKVVFDALIDTKRWTTIFTEHDGYRRHYKRKIQKIGL